MNPLEIKEKERISREDAAPASTPSPDALARDNELEFDRGGLYFKVHVADDPVSGSTPAWTTARKRLEGSSSV